MNVKIQGQNVKVSDQLTDFTQEKLGKLDRYLPNIDEVRVDISRTPVRRGGHQTKAQITLRHQRGAILRAEERIIGDDGDSVKVAIQKATDKMYRQIQRFKGKRRENTRRAPSTADVFDRYRATEEEIDAAEEVPDYEALAAEFEVEEQDVPEVKIVRRKVVELIPMNEAEAIDQMELLGHTFFMFHNSETNQINTLYRRDDGGYGLLVPLS